MTTPCILAFQKQKKTNIISIGEPAKTISFPIYTNEEFNFTNYNLTLDYNKLEEQDAIVVNELDEIPQALTTLKSFVEKVGI
jgi:nucleoid-associated protein YgaU